MGRALCMQLLRLFYVLLNDKKMSEAQINLDLFTPLLNDVV